MIYVGSQSFYSDHNSTFYSNLAWTGGAIRFYEATSEFMLTEFHHNYANQGGALSIEGGSNIQNFQEVKMYSNYAQIIAG